jgi:hypothetical protein
MLDWLKILWLRSTLQLPIKSGVQLPPVELAVEPTGSKHKSTTFRRWSHAISTERVVGQSLLGP